MTRSIACRATAVFIALVLSLGGCAEKSVEQLLAAAKHERDKGNYRGTIVHLKSVLQKSPDHAEARYLLGMTHIDTGDLYAAETELRRAIDLGYEPARLKIGKPLLLLGQYQKVLDQVRLDADLGDAEQAEILTMRAVALFGLGRNGEGRELLNKAFAKQPEFSDALLAEAILAAREKKTDEAMKFIDRALASAPKNVEAWMMKAELAALTADRSDALAAYRQALEINREHIHSRLAIAALQIDDRKFDDARKELAEVRKLAPENAMAKYLAALIEFRQKKYTAARDLVLDVLKVAPEHLPSMLLAGATEYNLGSHEQAQRHLSRVVERVPGHVHSRKLLVSSLARTGQMQRAIEVLRPALQNAPNDSELLALAGSIHLQTNEVSKAVELFEKAAKLDPKSAKMRTRLGLSRLAMGETDRALADLESAVELDSDDHQADIVLVMSHLRAKNYGQALQAMQTLEKKQPKNPFTYNLKAAIYLGKGDHASARKNLEHALQLSPTYVTAAVNLAEIDLHDKKPAAARRRFEAILEKDPSNADALTALANLAPRIGATQKELINWLERARKANPGSVQPVSMLVSAYTQSGDLKRALEVAQQAHSAQPNNLELLEALGAAQMAAGAKEQALTTYSKIVALQPNSASALVKLAAAQSANESATTAADTLRKAISLQPASIEAYVALAALEAKGGRLPAATKVAQELQKRLPNSPAGFVLEGNILSAEKKFAQAAKLYETAYGMSKSVTLLTKLHAAMLLAGRASEAESYVAKALTESPNDSELRMHVAEMRFKSGQYSSAIELYEWLLRKHPDDERFLNNLANAYQRAKDGRALETAERAYKLKPDNAAVADTLGWILVEQGNPKRGVEVLEKALTVEPKAPDIRYHLAHALAKTGDRPRARQELEKMLSDAPNSAYARDAKRLLADLVR